MAFSSFSGPNVDLRPVRRDDLEVLRAWRRDAGTHGPSVTVPWPMTDDRLEALPYPSDALRAFMGVALDGSAVGWFAFAGLDWKNRHVGLAWAVPARSGGVDEAEALGVLVRFAFLELGLSRVEADVLAADERAARTLARLAFRREALKREAARHLGRFADVALWGLLREEFEGSAAG